MYKRITVAPLPVRVRGTRATVAVTEVRYRQPDIYHAALKKTVSTETPVCCISLSITNRDKITAAFHSWRIFEALSDQKKAVLTDGEGNAYGLVSFGIDSYPVGMRQQADIGPGQTLSDQVLFFCDAKPSSDLELTLPCENMGGKGDIRFRIPREMIQ